MPVIQTWPGGGVIDYRGDPHGGGVEVRDGDRWRPAADAETRAIRVEETAKRLSDQEVYCCDSALVGDLLRLAGEGTFLGGQFDWDRVTNLRPDPSDWGVEQCRDWLDDNGHARPDPDPWSMTREQLVGEIHWGDDPDGDDVRLRDHGGVESLRARLVDDIDLEYVGGLHRWHRAVEDAAEDGEIFEWWRVSSWLAVKLVEAGESVLENDYGCWWGRQCTGQSYLMDGVFQKVAARLIDGK